MSPRLYPRTVDPQNGPAPTPIVWEFSTIQEQLEAIQELGWSELSPLLSPLVTVEGRYVVLYEVGQHMVQLWRTYDLTLKQVLVDSPDVVKRFINKEAGVFSLQFYSA